MQTDFGSTTTRHTVAEAPITAVGSVSPLSPHLLPSPPSISLFTMHLQVPAGQDTTFQHGHQNSDPMLKSNTERRSSARGLIGTPHSKRSGPIGLNQRMPKP